MKSAGLFLLLPAVFTEPARAFECNGRNFSIADGYTLSLAVPPELVERPVEACFDNKGRLYVTESSGSNEKVEVQLETKPHRLLRLTDTDGDGVFDHRTVFADKLMFPEGVLWHEGIVYVSAPPQIWKFTDEDDDGTADARSVWFDGKTLTGCANDLHGPYAGPDGLLYWCKGAFAEQTHDLPGKPGWRSQASHVFRMKPDGTQFDCVFTAGMDNPVGLEWTPEGDLIVSGTFLQNPGDGRRDGLIHAVRGGVWGKDHGVLEGHIRTGPLMPAMTHMGPAAPCGIARYGRDLLVCQFNLRKVSRHVLEPLGATWQTTDTDFLTSDHPDFHPTDVLQAPDGSVLVVDTGGWYKLCCPTSQIARPEVPGAIYRLRKTGGEVPVACPAPRWKLATPEEDPALLAEAGRGKLEAREKAVAQLLAPLAAQAKSPNLHIRRMAIEALGQWPSQHAALAREAPGMGELTLASRAIVAPLLVSAELPDTDRFLEHAISIALIEGADAREPRAFFRSDVARLQRIGLYWVSQTDPQMFGEPGGIGVFLSSADAGVREAAAFALRKVPEWHEPAEGWIRKALADGKDAATLRPAVTALMAEAGLRTSAGAWLDAAPAGPVRQMLLESMADAARRDGFATEWTGALLKVLETGEAGAVAAANVFTAKKGKWTEEVRKKLTALADDRTTPAAARLTLMLALSPVTPKDHAFADLVQSIQNNTPEADTAAAVISRATLTNDQLHSVAGLLPGCGLLRRPVLLRAFSQATDEALGLHVAAQLEKSGGLAGLSADDLATAFGKFPEPVQARLKAAQASLHQDLAAREARLNGMEKTLPAGDVRRGAVVFQSAKAACTLCHQAGYLGKPLGPDLSRVGAIRTRRDLLEAIVFPSASFVRSYEPILITKKNGDIAFGMVRSQNAAAVTLITGAVTPDVTVPAAEIAGIAPGPASLMPQGIDQILSPQELADVIAFLMSLK